MRQGTCLLVRNRPTLTQQAQFAPVLEDGALPIMEDHANIESHQLCLMGFNGESLDFSWDLDLLICPFHGLSGFDRARWTVMFLSFKACTLVSSVMIFIPLRSWDDSDDADLLHRPPNGRGIMGNHGEN